MIVMCMMNEIQQVLSYGLNISVHSRQVIFNNFGSHVLLSCTVYDSQRNKQYQKHFMNECFSDIPHDYYDHVQITIMKKLASFYIRKHNYLFS